MKKSVLVIVLILLMGFSVNASILDWLSGRVPYEPVFGFNDDSLSPMPLPENLGIPGVWTNKNPSFYKQGEEFMLWAKVIDTRYDYGPLLAKNNGSVLYSLVSDSILSEEGGWKLLIHYTEMIYDKESAYYYAKATIPSGISDEALKNLRILVDASNGKDMIRFTGRFSPTTVMNKIVDTLKAGECDMVGKKKVTFHQAKNSAALIEVDGVQQIIPTGIGEQLINGVRLKVVDLIDNPEVKNDMVRLEIITQETVNRCSLPEEVVEPTEEVVQPPRASSLSTIIIVNGISYGLNIGESIVVNGKKITLNSISSTEAIAISVDGVKEVIPVGQTKIVNGLKITNNQTIMPSKYKLNVGDSFIFFERKITLDNVGSTRSIAIDVDGTKEVISVGNTETVNGVEITNKDAFYNSKDPKLGSAVIILSMGFVGKEFLIGEPRIIEIEEKVLKECQSPNSLTYDQIKCLNDVVVREIKSDDAQRCDADIFVKFFSQYGGCTEPQAVYLAYSCIYTMFTDIRESLSICKLPEPMHISVELTEEGPILIVEGEQIIKSPEEIIITPEGEKVKMPFIPTLREGCVSGCLMDNGVCVPFGTRAEGAYCSITKQFLPQKGLKESCENSYECKSNECSDGECISTAGLLQKLLDLLSKLFGGK